ncbi:MAG: hypothetical protein ACLT98_11255 [Eggerthellaceae bacterium]
MDHGVAVDTSMGLTPLDGLMMGTRCGAIDPAIVPFVMEHENLTGAEMNDLMNKKSGLLGISGISNDLRSVRDASEKGDERAMLAYDMYSNSVKKYIGQYIAVMGGVDAIVLTAGVGENCEKMRRMIRAPAAARHEPDEEKNRQRGFEREISADSPVKIIIIPTNEEYMIARDTYDISTRKWMSRWCLRTKAANDGALAVQRGGPSFGKRGVRLTPMFRLGLHAGDGDDAHDVVGGAAADRSFTGGRCPG